MGERERERERESERERERGGWDESENNIPNQVGERMWEGRGCERK